MPAAADRVRPANPQDVDAAVETLGQAFADYSWIRHTVAADDHGQRVRRMQRLFFEHIGLVHGSAWVSDDVSAVAVWTTPDTDVAAAFAPLAEAAAEISGDRAEFSARAEEAMNPHRPTTPVWFLGTVGVRPDVQGRGLGKAVIQPGLDAAEKAGVPAFLETSEEGNVRLYEKLGFTITAEVRLPDDGPTTWCMVREPVR
ncbi:GNAT family N-acetyltransferase [Spiractinospora alimapuensis]|uniref:GNAT family N-acetyltransferase n=1 Tax=Spiractinospora alimapuensis TaxID=2820884 RepID=UPI001F46A50A|nr:GNAT family N-acetyltransferase [Spiractinospora alimapuensis]QVQ51743.1 GNAT family N-acetyltransferase [Spiractinospora alimapuensis]